MESISSKAVSVTIEQLEAEALRLTPAERARLAQRLIASLDANVALAAAWYAEAERRLEAVESGRLPEVLADEVFEELGLGALNYADILRVPDAEHADRW